MVNYRRMPVVVSNWNYELFVFQLLRFVKTIMLFSHKNIDPNAISCNKLILLHGPPGELVHLSSTTDIQTVIRLQFMFFFFSCLRYGQNQFMQGIGPKDRHSHK